MDGGFSIGHQVLFLLTIFTLIAIQNLLGYFLQIRQYQKLIKKWISKGILGVGQRRGLFTPGEIIVFVYNPRKNEVITVQSMRGYSIFALFREKPEFSGLSLEELHNEGLKADRRDLRIWRILFRYKLYNPTKRKGALIQAVEAVEKHLRENSFVPIEKLIQKETEPRNFTSMTEQISGPDEIT